MYRLLGDNHVLDGLPFSAQVFLRALDGVRNRLAFEAGVTGKELRALSRIAESSGLDNTAMGDFLEVRPSSANEVIERLVLRGLIVSTPAEREHSAVTMTLTPAGHELIATTYKNFQRIMNDAAESLDADRLIAFESGLLKMARKLDAQAAPAISDRN